MALEILFPSTVLAAIFRSYSDGGQLYLLASLEAISETKLSDLAAFAFFLHTSTNVLLEGPTCEAMTAQSQCICTALFMETFFSTKWKMDIDCLHIY